MSPAKTSRTSSLPDNSAAAWLDLCRAIGTDLRPAVLKIAGTPKAAAVVNPRGAGGDETTYVDALAERIVAKHLKAFRARGRTFSLLTEETGYHDYGAPFPLILIDPIDGSINCKRGIPFYAISMAVYDGPCLGRGVFGYIMNLANGDELHAAAGSGRAFLNGKLLALAPNRRRTVDVLFYEISKRKNIHEWGMPVILNAHKSRSMGSMALAMAYTATGAADLYAHLKATRVLDYSAGKIILEESGGCCTGESGQTLDSLPLDLSRQGMILAARSRTIIRGAVNMLHGGA